MKSKRPVLDRLEIHKRLKRLYALAQSTCADEFALEAAEILDAPPPPRKSKVKMREAA